MKKKRYINHNIEKELIEYKKEVEGKFKKSELRKFKFPLVIETNDDIDDNYCLESFLPSLDDNLHLKKQGSQIKSSR